MKKPILSVIDENGNVIPIRAIQGKPGITPHIGENGNWWIGDTDTGVRARGEPYTLTEEDKAEIAEEAAKLVEVPGEGVYRLLKTITLTEEVSAVEEKFDTKYDGMIIVIEGIAITGSQIRIYCGVGGNSLDRAIGATLSKNNVMRMVARKLNGTWDIFGYYGGASNESTMIGQVSANKISSTDALGVPAGFADRFVGAGYFKVYTFDGMLPVGMTVKIFVLGGETNA